MFYVYVLISIKDHKLYVGYTNNLQRRVKEHKNGKSSSTKNRLPLELIYYEAYQNQHEAKRREKFLKGGNGRGELKTQLKETLEKYNYKYLMLSLSKHPITHPTFKPFT